MKIIGYIALKIMLTIYSSIMNGWALMKIWGWFIVPIFNAPSFGMAQSIGFALLVSFLVTNRRPPKEEKSYSSILLESFFTSSIYPVLSVAIGFIITKFL